MPEYSTGGGGGKKKKGLKEGRPGDAFIMPQLRGMTNSIFLLRDYKRQILDQKHTFERQLRYFAHKGELPQKKYVLINTGGKTKKVSTSKRYGGAPTPPPFIGIKARSLKKKKKK